MPDQKPMLEYANKSIPGDSRRVRSLIVLVLFALIVIVLTAPFWWERLWDMIPHEPIVDAITWIGTSPDGKTSLPDPGTALQMVQSPAQKLPSLPPQ